MLPRDVFDIFATHSGFERDDVTDANCWAQNGSTPGRVLVNLER